MTLQEEWVDLFAAICDSPEDWTLRLVAADWCEEHDLPGWAECLRWVAKHKKRAMTSYDGWHWYDESAVGSTLSDYDPGSNLPTPVWKALRKHDDLCVLTCKEYDSRAASEDDLLWAWQMARGDGWTPEEDASDA